MELEFYSSIFCILWLWFFLLGSLLLGASKPYFFSTLSFRSPFPHEKLLIFMSAIVGICCAILLGFADDMLDLRWRHKLLFPTLSSLPLLLVYYATGNYFFPDCLSNIYRKIIFLKLFLKFCYLGSSTTIIVPSIVRKIIPVSENIDIGFLYYLYMGIMVWLRPRFFLSFFS